jgi:glycosyltransferase involved in cell wall biosynthesis
MQPAGGTEIQLAYLKKYINQGAFDAVQITTSVPEKIPLDPLKANILWQKNSWDQPNLYPWFKNKDNHSKYDWYVFNSHWNYHNFRKQFNIPEDRCTVIKNAIDYTELQLKTDFTPKDKIKMCYISTPWRGLEIALAAMEGIKDPNVTLDVYSSTEIYGKQFKDSNDSKYLPLYEKAKSLPNVNYMGYCDHTTLMSKLKDYDVNCFPSIWEETFCISAMESLAAGQILITTDLGAHTRNLL